MHNLLRLALAAATFALFALLPGVPSAQTNDLLIKSLYGKVFVSTVSGGPFGGAINDELHISKDGDVTAIIRILALRTAGEKPGAYVGQVTAWAKGRLTGRSFRLDHAENPDARSVFGFEVARDGMTIKLLAGSGRLYVRQ